jgi:hypothetical protein
VSVLPSVPSPVPPAAPTRGRGQVIAGIVLVALSVVIGTVATASVASRVDVGSLERNVRVEGPDRVIVPGEVRFAVVAPLDDGARAEMDVGIGVARRGGPVPACTLSTAAGEELPTERPLAETTLVDDSEGRFQVVTVAELPPGDYVARCTVAGEPTQRPDAEMTVGRTFGFGDVEELIGPIVWFLGGVGVAGLLFLVGVILLIVGLVRRSRAARPPAPGGWPPQPVAAPGPWGPTQANAPRPGPVAPPPGGPLISEPWGVPAPGAPPAPGQDARPDPSAPTPPAPPPAPPVPGAPKPGWTVPEPKSDRPTWRPPSAPG